MLQNSPSQKNLVLEIEASLRTLEVSIVFKLRVSFEHLQLHYCSCFLVNTNTMHTTKKLFWGTVILISMSPLEYAWGCLIVAPLLPVWLFKYWQLRCSGWFQSITLESKLVNWFQNAWGGLSKFLTLFCSVALPFFNWVGMSPILLTFVLLLGYSWLLRPSTSKTLHCGGLRYEG
jgi:hypothetical protein